MTSLAGAIVVLAGSVALGLGAIASAPALRGTQNDGTAASAMAAGGFLVAFGIVVLLVSFLKENKPKT
jgi:hypothetical protein